MDQLESNMLYDLYRDDFKELKNINKFPLINTSKEIKSFHSYVTAASKNQSVSCHTWHPTIPGVNYINHITNNIFRQLIKLHSCNTMNFQVFSQYHTWRIVIRLLKLLT